jgi:tetratricopeptide (TPR) repeat protein
MQGNNDLRNATIDFLRERFNKDSGNEIDDVCSYARVTPALLRAPTRDRIPARLTEYFFDDNDPDRHLSDLLLAIFAVYSSHIPRNRAFLAQVGRYAIGLAQNKHPEAEKLWQTSYLLKEESEILREELDALLKAHVKEQLNSGAFPEAEALLEALLALAAPLPSISALLEEHPKRQHERAIMHHQQGGWDEAIKQLESLLKLYPNYKLASTSLAKLQKDAEAHSATQRLIDTAWAEQDWPTAEENLRYLAKERWANASEQLKLLSSCRIEVTRGNESMRKRDWADAEAAYGHALDLINTYDDARRGQLRARAHSAVDQAKWQQAESALTQLFEIGPDTFGEAELLVAVRTLRHGLARLQYQTVVDPQLRWNGPFPYQTLYDAGLEDITPDSSMRSIEGLRQQVEAATADAPLAIAWQFVHSVEHRLFVDAFLYPKMPTQEVVVFLEQELRTNGRLPLGGQIVERFSWQASLVFVVLEDRASAVKTLVDRQAAMPKESMLAHTLGLLLLADAEELAFSGRPAEAIIVWRQAIGQWAAALADDDYWAHWADKRVAHYDVGNHSVDKSQIERLIARIVKDLQRRIDDSHEPYSGDEEHARSFGLLRLELLAELEAACLLRSDLRSIVAALPALPYGGPALLQQLNVEPLLLDRLAPFSPGKANQNYVRDRPHEETLEQFRWLFSSLRLAAAAIREKQLTFALDLLGDQAPMPDEPVYNMLDKSARLARRDWVLLHIEAHILRPIERLRGGEPWDEGAQTLDWQTALDLAETLGRRTNTAAMIGRRVSRAAQELREALDDPPDDTILDRSIRSLLAANQLIGANDGLFTELLWQLDVRISSADADSDGERALATLDEVAQQARVLEKYSEYKNIVARIKKVRAAIRKRNDPDVALKQILDDIDYGIHLIDASLPNEPAQALNLLERCWNLAPADMRVHNALLRVMASVGQLLANNKRQDTLQTLLTAWLPRAQAAGFSPDQIGFLTHGGHVLHLLTTHGRHPEVVGGHIWLKLDSPYVGTQKMRLSFDGDDLIVWAELPPIEADEIVALGALLVLTIDTVFCRLCDMDGMGYGLVCRMPMHHLEDDTDWLHFLVSSLHGYVTFAPDKFLDQGALSQHINERRHWGRKNNPRAPLSQKAKRAIDQMFKNPGLGFENAYYYVRSDGIQLVVPYGLLPAEHARNRWLRKIIDLNARIGLSKIALDGANECVVCCYEDLYLNYESLRFAKDSLASALAILRRELT